MNDQTLKNSGITAEIAYTDINISSITYKPHISNNTDANVSPVSQI